MSKAASGLGRVVRIRTSLLSVSAPTKLWLTWRAAHKLCKFAELGCPPIRSRSRRQSAFARRAAIRRRPSVQQTTATRSRIEPVFQTNRISLRVMADFLAPTKRLQRRRTQNSRHSRRRLDFFKSLILLGFCGGQGRNRTTDTRIFNPTEPVFTFVDCCRYNLCKSTSYSQFGVKPDSRLPPIALIEMRLNAALAPTKRLQNAYKGFDDGSTQSGRRD